LFDGEIKADGENRMRLLGLELVAKEVEVGMTWDRGVAEVGEQMSWGVMGELHLYICICFGGQGKGKPVQM
jgi:hypothetical protein